MWLFRDKYFSRSSSHSIVRSVTDDKKEIAVGPFYGCRCVYNNGVGNIGNNGFNGQKTLYTRAPGFYTSGSAFRCRAIDSARLEPFCLLQFYRWRRGRYAAATNAAAGRRATPGLKRNTKAVRQNVRLAHHARCIAQGTTLMRYVRRSRRAPLSSQYCITTTITTTTITI